MLAGNHINLFAEAANLTTESIIKYVKIWDERCFVKVHKKNSLGRWEYHEYMPRWEYLCRNKNIEWNDSLFEQLIGDIPIHCISTNHVNIRLSIGFIEKHWELRRTEVVSSHVDYHGDRRLKEETIRFVEQIKDCEILNMDFEIFRENELKWWGTLIDGYYINDSILNVLLAKKTELGLD